MQPSPPESREEEELLQTCINLLLENDVKVVAFDMDLTAVAEHSRGELLRTSLGSYLSKATPHFLALVPRLHEKGFKLAIATHSDEAQFDGLDIQRGTHILGEELAKALLSQHFPVEIATSFAVIAYNPRFHPERKNSETHKRYHMTRLQTTFDVAPAEIIFFDDTETVVTDCRDQCGVRAIRVDPTFGFRMCDLLSGLQTT